MKTLTKTLKCTDSKLYGVWDGQRHLLSEQDPVIEFYTDSIEVRVLGSAAAHFKKRRAAIVLYGTIDTVQDIDAKSINHVRNCTLSTNVLCSDESNARHFSSICLSPIDIEIGGRWEFEITDTELTTTLSGM